MKEPAGLILILIVGAIIVGPLLWSVSTATKTPTPDADGWVNLKGTISQWMFGAFMIVLGPAFAVFGILGLIGGWASVDIGAKAFLAVATLMGCGFITGFFQQYACRIRYNQERLEYSSAFKKISVFWNEVEEIRVGFYGPAIYTADGRIVLSNLLRGFYGLLETARSKDVKIQDSPYLKPHKSAKQPERGN